MLWSEFETEMGTIRSTLAAVRDDVPTMDAIRRGGGGQSFSAAEHYEPWEQAIREFTGQRLGSPEESLARLRRGDRCSLCTGLRTSADRRGRTLT